MKSDIAFLRALRKELHFLNEQEKDSFIIQYQTKINDRYQKGEKLKKIIGSFEHPKTIANKIYAEKLYSEDKINLNLHTSSKSKAGVKMGALTATLSLIPQFFILIFSLILIITGLFIGISSIVVFVLCWLNFDPLQAIGPSILAIGLLPLIGLLLFWIGKKLYLMEVIIFRAIWNPIRREEKKQSTRKNGKKIAFISCLSVFTIFTLGGAAGSFAGDKTIGWTTITGNLLHTQNETLNLSEFTETSSEPIRISYSSVQHLTWYSLHFIKDWTMKDSNLEITRNHNTKESLKMKFSVKKEDDNNFTLKVDMPWNLLVFNMNSNKFTLRYNPTKIDFGV